MVMGWGWDKGSQLYKQGLAWFKTPISIKRRSTHTLGFPSYEAEGKDR